MSTTFKRIPYGIADFRQVRRENMYLVDKSMFFEKMENAGHFLFLVRPRRFGKSLFLDMLEAYYDIKDKDNFQKLFKGMYVADHPTPEQGEFLVLHLDFSMMGSDLENLYENFNRYLSQRCLFDKCLGKTEEDYSMSSLDTSSTLRICPMESMT